MKTESLNKQAENEEISLKEIILKLNEWYKYLLSRWLIILICVLIGSSLGLTYAFLKKPTYTATTTFVLETGDGAGGGLGQYAGLASMVGIDIGGGGGGLFQGDNIIELYKSRSMIEKTLLTEVNFEGKKQLLIDRYIDFKKLRKAWNKNPKLKGLNFSGTKTERLSKNTRLKDSIMSIIVKDINANSLVVSKPDKKTSIIQADVKSTDEFFAKKFNDELVKNVNDFYLKTKTKKSLDNVAILSQKVDSVRSVMNGAIYNAVAVADATPNLNPTRQVQRAVPVQKSQFSAETNKAILSELVKNLETSKLSLMKETPLIQLVDTPIYPLNKQYFGKLKGIIVGGFIAGFLVVLILLSKKMLRSILE